MNTLEHFVQYIFASILRLPRLCRQAINRGLNGYLFGNRNIRVNGINGIDNNVTNPCNDSKGVTDNFDSFCIYPFFSINLLSNGTIKPCCAFSRSIEKDGRSLSIYEHTVDEIWNSVDMRQIRRSMVKGRPVDACNYCYNQERKGLRSMRMVQTDYWVSGLLNPSLISIDQVKARNHENNYEIPGGPEWFDLDVGNVCNLKCRTCHALSSSGIANDPIHSRWCGLPPMPLREIAHSRLAGSAQWYRHQEFLKGELLGNYQKVKKINLVGGEPLLTKEIRYIMRHLIEIHAAHNIMLVFTTNGTCCDEEWLELASKFSKITMAISIDGFELMNEYLRFPSKWQSIETNTKRFTTQLNANVFVNMTVHIYNIFNIVELAKFCSRMGVAFQGHMLQYPEYLSPFILPYEIRRCAADRLRSCAKTLCVSQTQIPLTTVPSQNTSITKELESLACALESGPRDSNADLMHRFMLFTNDLDFSRGQSFAEASPELKGMIENAGFPWIHDKLYA